MPFAAVLDTCELYPAHLRDTLLRLAECDLYRPLWSGDILDELDRGLTRSGIPPRAVTHLLAEMRRSFPDALVTQHRPHIASLTCDPKDRHMLAAAVRSKAGALVTFNIADFPDSSVASFEIDVVHPADFLLDLLDLAPGMVLDELDRQAKANRRRPRTLPNLLDALARSGVRAFSDEARRQLQSTSGMGRSW